MDTPQEGMMSHVSAFPSVHFDRIRKGQPQSAAFYYRPTEPLTNPIAPYRVVRGTVAMLANFSTQDMHTPVEGMQPFFTSYNNALVQHLAGHVPVPIGIVVADTATDMVGSEPVTVQTGGVVTTVNTGKVRISPGDWIAIKMPERDLSDLTMPNDPANRGVIRPVTYPMAQRSAIYGTLLSPASADLGAADFGDPEQLLHGLQPAGLFTEAMINMMAIGSVMARTCMDELKTESDRTIGGYLAMFGVIPGSEGHTYEVDEVPTELATVRTMVRKWFRHAITGTDALESGGVDYRVQLTNAVSLMIGAMVSAAHRERASILGKAVTGAEPGAAMDILLTHSFGL
jgi:hypothetical protein